MKLVIFDFDGTLVDSRALIFESNRIVFPRFGLPVPSPAESLSRVGKSLRVVLGEVAGEDAPIGEMIAAFDEVLPQLRADPLFAEQPFDGAADLLRELHSRHDRILGIATGHRADTLSPALQSLQWVDYFRTIQSSDNVPSKPHPAMLHQALAATGMDAKDTIFIGDTSFDMEMGRAANVRTIGVGWGYHTTEQLMDSGAAHVVETFEELKSTIREVLDA